MAKFILVLSGNYRTFTMSSKLPNRCDGLEAVDLIRKTLECELPLDRIHETKDVSDSHVNIELDENTARMSGLFNNSFYETIEVQEGTTLNSCLLPVVVVKRDESTNEIICSYIQYRFDTLTFLKLWESNNYPKEINEPLFDF